MRDLHSLNLWPNLNLIRIQILTRTRARALRALRAQPHSDAKLSNFVGSLTEWAELADYWPACSAVSGRLLAGIVIEIGRRPLVDGAPAADKPGRQTRMLASTPDRCSRPIEPPGARQNFGLILATT